NAAARNTRPPVVGARAEAADRPDTFANPPSRCRSNAPRHTKQYPEVGLPCDGDTEPADLDNRKRRGSWRPRTPPGSSPAPVLLRAAAACALTTPRKKPIRCSAFETHVRTRHSTRRHRAGEVPAPPAVRMWELRPRS